MCLLKDSILEAYNKWLLLLCSLVAEVTAIKKTQSVLRDACLLPCISLKGEITGLSDILNKYNGPLCLELKSAH